MPPTDADVIEKRLDSVSAIVNAVASENEILWKLSDLFQHVKKKERELSAFTAGSDATDSSEDNKLSLAEFDGLQKWINVLRVLSENCLGSSECSADLECLYTTQLRPIRDICSRDLHPFCDLVQETTADIDRDANSIAEVSPESEMRFSVSHLRELRTQIHLCEQEVTAAAHQVARLLRIAEDRIKVIYADDEQSNIGKVGIVLRVSRQDNHRVQQQSGNMLSVIRASRASGVWFSTPIIDLLGAKWKVLKQSYDDAEANLAGFLSTVFQTHFRGFLGDLVARISELDVLVSFALVSHKHKFVRAGAPSFLVDLPDFKVERVLRLKGIFDPFAANTLTDGVDASTSSEEVTVELSCHGSRTFLLLDSDGDSEHTSLLQLLGIVVMLNQLGCFVPCKEAVLPVFDSIYLRTGAYDQQFHGYSTFMTEMQEMSHIFSTMTPMSLVLIEDLCRGTSTNEGLALALSMCFHLMETKIFTCFSSRWRELTDQLAQQPATATPVWGLSNRVASRLGRDIYDSSQNVAAFDRLIWDCDLPQDLIDSIHEELHTKTLPGK